MAQFLSPHRILVLQSGLLLPLTRLALGVFRFKTILRLIDTASTKACTRSSDATDVTQRVTWAVKRAGRYAPAGHHCLTRALVAKFLLAQRGISSDLRIGVAKNSAARLIAHAWLEAEGVPIFGVSEFELEQYRLLPQFNRV